MRIVDAAGHVAEWQEISSTSVGAGAVGGWLALEGVEPVTGLSVHRRPDDRLFVRFHGSADTANRAELLSHATSHVGQPLHVTCRHSDQAMWQALETARFSVVLEEDVFSITFERALRQIRRAWVPSGYSIVTVLEAELDRVVDLDNRLRSLVPGTDGWRGDGDAIERDLADRAPFDPSAYLVGRRDSDGRLVGLIRFWRNASGPRLGMVAVDADLRSTTMGPALLELGLTAAATWGSDRFTTETARTNQHIHPRLTALGADRVDSFAIFANLE